MFIGEDPIHINAEIGSIAELVLMPGDPLRAKYIAENFLEDAKLVCDLRNMLGFTGYYKDTRVSVIGSGMGMPSMGIYSWELYHYFNVKKIIRIGTCGAVSEEVGIKELILASNVYSESNFAYTYNDYKEHLVYPSKELNNKIIETSNKLGYKLHVGTVCTMDVFGPFIDYDRVLNRIPKELNVLGEEMEAFALCHIANSFNREASCIITVVDSKYSDEVISGEDREKSLNEMITLALESLI
jgi:purine-nucleoside phosphorylase